MRRQGRHARRHRNRRCRRQSGSARISIDLSLHEASVAPRDTSFSKLRFAAADLRLQFEDGRRLFAPPRPDYPLQRASCWVWAGPRAPRQPMAGLDLSRAVLTCARDYDLMRLEFSFTTSPSRLRRTSRCCHPARDDGRVLVREDGTVLDSRPILIAEFAPQHVMEEALFLPEPPPPIDVSTDEPWSKTTIITELANTQHRRQEGRLPAQGARGEVHRHSVQEIRSRVQGQGRSPRLAGGPANLRRAVRARSGRNGHRPRSGARQGEVPLREALDGALKRAAELADPKSEAGKVLQARRRPIAKELSDRVANAVFNEALFEQALPDYALFREFWRDRIVKVLADLAAGRPLVPEIANIDPAGIPTEFLIDGNRPDPEFWTDKPGTALLGAMKASFLTFARGSDDVVGLAAGRLSPAPAELAFRINCTPLAGLDATQAGLPIPRPTHRRTPALAARSTPRSPSPSRP